MAEPTITNAQGLARLTLKTSVSAKVGELIGFDGTDFVLADADGPIPAQFMAMETVAAGAALAVCTMGTLFDSDAPYTLGADQWLGATAGAHTPTRPAASATLTLNQRIGQALSTTDLAFNLARRGFDVLRATVSYDPASLAAVTERNDAITVTGILTGDHIRNVSAPPSGTGWDTGLFISQIDFQAADTVRARLVNATAGALDGAAITLTLLVER